MNEVIAAFWQEETPYAWGAVLALAAVLYRFMAGGRVTVRHSLLLAAFFLLLDVVAAVLSARQQPAVAGGLHQAAVLGVGVVLIRLSGLTLFRVLLPALRLPTPRIVEDIVFIGGYLLWGMVRLSFAGVELSSLVTTSAVITAVIAFAMQDTLGNILGGLALQLDDSLKIGDWVRVDDVCGRVVEIQWRYTALLTRNGERVVVPNAQLMKTKFTVLGERRRHRLGGAPRCATVVAASDVECYRLDKSGFEDIIHQRHTIADSMSHILAQRPQQNEALKNAYANAPGDSERTRHGATILQRIRDFFGLR